MNSESNRWADPRSRRRTDSTRPRFVGNTMRLSLLVACCLAPASCEGLAGGGTAAEAQDSPETTVREVLQAVPLIDGHNDIPWQFHERVNNHLALIDFRDTTALTPAMHTDLKRLEEGGVGGQFWSVYIPASFDGPGAARRVLQQIDLVHRLAAAYPEDLEIALTADDIERIHGEGKVASLIGMEGGHSIENSLAVLRQLYAVGARYMTLTHSSNVDWADSATDQAEFKGLTLFGREVVREMNRLGMLIDLSHVSAATMFDAIEASEAPVIFSHSSARGVTDHPRNVPDAVLEKVRENEGVVMVTFVPSFINSQVRDHSNRLILERRRLNQLHNNPDKVKEALQGLVKRAPSATLSDVADHIDHIKERIGVDYIGIGSDFDGIRSVPEGLEDVTKMPDLFVELLARGYSREDLEKIAGRNVLRAMRKAEEVAKQLQEERPPGDALIWEIDGGDGGNSDDATTREDH